MNILFFCSYPFPSCESDYIFCGGQYFSYYFALSMASEGVNIHVITRMHRGAPAKEKKGNLTIHRHFSLCYLGGHQQGLTFSLRRRKIVNRLCNEIDFDWVISLSPLTLELGILRRKRLPLCYMVPGVNIGFLKNLGLQPMQILRRLAIRYISKPLLKKNIQQSKVITTFIQNDIKLIERYYSPPIDIQLIHNGVDTQIYNDFILPQSKTNRFLCVGRFSREKGFKEVVQAAIQLREKRIEALFHFIGFIDNRQYFDEIKQLISLNDLDSYIKIDTNVPEKKMPSYYQKALAFISYSNGYDPFPSVIYQAMASGLPIISTDWVARREIVQDGYNGILVPAGRTDLLSKAIRRILDDTPMTIKMGKNARQSVCQKHDFSILSKKLLWQLKQINYEK